jgi:hypothetical protein
MSFVQGLMAVLVVILFVRLFMNGEIMIIIQDCLCYKHLWLVWSLLYAHRHRSRLGAAGYIILTPANQLMVLGLKIWLLSNPGSKQRPFDHLPTSLPTALTGPTGTERKNCIQFTPVAHVIKGRAPCETLPEQEGKLTFHILGG